MEEGHHRRRVRTRKRTTRRGAQDPQAKSMSDKAFEPSSNASTDQTLGIVDGESTGDDVDTEDVNRVGRIGRGKEGMRAVQMISQLPFSLLSAA